MISADRSNEPMTEVSSASSGIGDVEAILAQQLSALRTVMSETQRASSLAGGSRRLHRKIESELREMQQENKVLRTQLTNASLVPEVSRSVPSVEDVDSPLQAWSNAGSRPIGDTVVPGAVDNRGSASVDNKSIGVSSDPLAPDANLAPIMPVTSLEDRQMREVENTHNTLNPWSIQSSGEKSLTVGRAQVPGYDSICATQCQSQPVSACASRHRNHNNPFAPTKTRFSDNHSKGENTAENDHEETRIKKKEAVFADANALKEKLKMNVAKPPYDVKNFYHQEGCAQAIARSAIFDHATMSVIGFNAIWIAVDTDFNHEDVLIDAHPIFIIMENFFCFYFFTEWLLRFLSFKLKRKCFRDAWFVFDSLLVTAMVGETWVLQIIVMLMGGSGNSLLGNASILKLFRLLRLTRMARMARLLRAMPELMVLIKGMLEAMRSVFFTLCLLAGMLYIFGITFVLLMKDTDVGDEHFKNVGEAMNSLLLKGVLPDFEEFITTCASEGWVYRILILVYILIATLTIMNMLVGVLCEVVTVVSSVEKESMLLNYVKDTLQHMLATSGIGTNSEQAIQKDEFMMLLELPGAAMAIQEVGVDAVGLMDFTDFIFADGKEALTFPEFMEVILQFRSTNTATVKDVVDLRRYLGIEFETIGRSMQKQVEQTLASFLYNFNSTKHHGIVAP